MKKKQALLLFFSLICITTFAQPGKPNIKAMELFNAAMQDYQILEYADALDDIEKAIKKDKTYFEAYDLKGIILKDMGQTDLAIASYKEMIEIFPEVWSGYLGLSELLFENKRYTEAAEVAEKGLTLEVPEKSTHLLKKVAMDSKFAQFAFKNPVKFEPKNVGKGINSQFEEYFPGFTIDGELAFFTRRDGTLPIREQNEDLYYATLDENGEWKNGRTLGQPINTPENEGAFSTSPNGKYLFFTSCNRPGGSGSCDIWLAVDKNGKWEGPYNISRKINTRNWEAQPSLSSDGKTLYFSSGRPGGQGGTDLWYSTFGNTGWSEPENLGPEINTPFDEQFPFIHADGKTLYFSSAGHPGMGQTDLFFSRKVNGKWSKPVNVGYPVNSAGKDWNLVVTPDGKTAYFSSDSLKPNYGGMDIYRFELPEHARPSYVSYLKGIITDKKTGQPVEANIELIDLETGEIVYTASSSNVDGGFITPLPVNKDYALNVNKEKYLFHSENFALLNATQTDPFVIEVALQPIEKEGTVVLNNVFFDTDKFELKPASEAELNKLKNFLEENPELKIEIGGHTDNRGSADHNLTLSKNRAEAVYNYLIENGISQERLSFKGYGSSIPIATNETEEGRAKNRRTEFKIF